jgi:hypothetical protein
MTRMPESMASGALSPPLCDVAPFSYAGYQADGGRGLAGDAEASQTHYWISLFDEDDMDGKRSL